MLLYNRQPLPVRSRPRWETPRRTFTSTTTMKDGFNPHFVVVSLGNPPPHAESLHSAGHVAVQSLQRLLRLDLKQPEFASERVGKKATQVSRSPKFTILQSPTLMNVSGPWMAKAWNDVRSDVQHQEPDRPVGLVVVHDELEEDMCVTKVRKWERSHRGHNGLKSTQASIQQHAYPKSKLAKISIGIGRPEARDPNTVSQYVLRPMSKYQKQLLLDSTGRSTLAALQEIEATWKAQILESGLSDE